MILMILLVDILSQILNQNLILKKDGTAGTAYKVKKLGIFNF